MPGPGVLGARLLRRRRDCAGDGGPARARPRGRPAASDPGVVAITISWNVAEAVVALLAGRAASSAALIGFGLDSVIEVLSAAAVAWQFAAPDPVAALVIAVFAVRDGVEAWKGDACCATPVDALNGEREAEGCEDDCCAPARRERP